MDPQVFPQMTPMTQMNAFLRLSLWMPPAAPVAFFVPFVFFMVERSKTSLAESYLRHLWKKLTIGGWPSRSPSVLDPFLQAEEGIFIEALRQRR